MMMHKQTIFAKLATSIIVVSCLNSIDLLAAEFIVKDVNRTQLGNATWIALPYLFSSNSTGLTVGAIGIFNGFLQPQVNMFVTAYVGEKLPVQKLNGSDTIENREVSSKGTAFGINGYRPSFARRMFLSLLVNYAYYPNQRIYLDGSNESQQNFDSEESMPKTPFETQGFNNWVNLDFRYVLPIGEGKDNVTPLIKLDKGIAVNRSNKGNQTPFITGQTLFSLEFFYREFSVEKLLNTRYLNSNGIRVALEHDNTDYPDNPSRGYNFKVKSSMDFGLYNSSQSWNTIEAAYSHYIELPNFSWSRQNVIVLNTWTAYSPSWDASKRATNELLDNHQPPMWEGARLGGYNRMRAYDMNRFNDKAAIYFAAEYRVIPDYNPLKSLSWNPLPIDWFQTVLFVEAGRVAPKYDFKELMNDMKYDVGVSLRALTAKVPLRFEIAYGGEGASMWVMLNQPF